MHFVLVHGTFSGVSAWQAFTDEFSKYAPEATCEPWPWSGTNLQHGRVAAAGDLISHLTSRSSDVTQPTFLVGHSHGGNVCTAAAARLPPGIIAGIIYVGTPHIRIEQRAIASIVDVAAYYLGGILTGLLGLVALGICVAIGYTLESVESHSFRIAGAAIGILALGLILGLIVKCLKTIARLTRLKRWPWIWRLLRHVFRARSSAIGRQVVAVPQLPTIDLTTSFDEAFHYLRSVSVVSELYRFMLTAHLTIYAFVGFSAIVVSAIFPLMAIGWLGLVIADPATVGRLVDEKAILHLAPNLAFLVIIPVVTILLVAFYAWLFTGHGASIGLRNLGDLLFLKVRLANQQRGADAPVKVIPTPTFTWPFRLPLRHCAILWQKQTVHEAVDWARRI